MSGQLVATCDRELSGVPEWVHLFPPGKMTGRDGRSFDLVDPGALVLAFQSSGVDLPIDYEHQSERADGQNNGPVPAAGWITDLQSRTDGIWARVSWTARARELIGNREYRYLSPAFLYHKTTKQITRLKGAGLVHNPNLHLTALASEEDPMPDDPMLLTQLAEILGLGEDADEAAVLDALKAALADRGTPDPRKYVPIEAVKDLIKQNADTTATMSEERARGKVEKALAKGHISPAMTEWAVQLCQTDEASFDEFISGTPPMFGHLMHETHTARRFDAPKDRLTSDVEDAVCKQLGLTPDQLNS